jgi:hypothetical protein
VPDPTSTAEQAADTAPAAPVPFEPQSGGDGAPAAAEVAPPAEALPAPVGTAPVAPTAAPAAAPAAAGGPTTPAVDGATFGEYYYGHDCGIPYERSAHWNQFFAAIAERIVRELHPVSVLDAGCAIGMLVEQLRNRGVDAFGVDISQYAHDQMPDGVREHCWVGSLTEPLPRRYDLITSVEVIEHIPAAEGRVALDNICAATDRLLLSTSPFDYGEPTHLNVNPPEYWSQLLATNGFVRDVSYDASYLTPWAALYVRSDASLPEVVRDYDRSWWRLRFEVHEVRGKVLQLQQQLEAMAADGSAGAGSLAAENEKLRAEQVSLSEEILRLRDSVVGKDAELGTAHGRIAELTAMLHRFENITGRLDDVLQSKSWRLMWAAGTPVRMLRERSKGS